MSVSELVSQNQMFELYRAVERAIGVTDYSKRLIHYTSFEVLKAMVEGRELWFGRLTEMNDPSECDHFLDGVIDGITKIKLHADLDLLSAHLRNTAAAMKQNTYVSSWCEYFDSEPSGNRSMWIEYGNHGKGLGVVIDSSGFIPSALTPQKIGFGVNASIVKYIPKQNIPYEVSDLVQRLSQLDAIRGSLSSTAMMAILLLAKAATIKHDAYAAEREIRFLFMDFLRGGMSGALPSFEEQFSKTINADTGRSFLRVPLKDYPKFQMDLRPETLLKRIVIGSSFSTKIERDQVVQLLSDNGLHHVEVVLSDIPMK